MYEYKSQIIHQTQPTSMSCSATCVAMLAGVPVNEILRRMPEPATDEDVLAALARAGLFGIPNYGDLIDNRVYIVTVSSLNSMSQLHDIIVDTRNGWVEIFDPAQGRVLENGEPARFYTLENFSGIKSIEVKIVN